MAIAELTRQITRQSSCAGLLGSPISAVESIAYHAPTSDDGGIRSLAIGRFPTPDRPQRRLCYRRFLDETAHLYAYLVADGCGTRPGALASRLILSGPFASTVPEPGQGTVLAVIDIAFEANLLPAVFGIPAAGLVGVHRHVEELLGPHAIDLLQEVIDAPDLESGARRLEHRLLPRTRRSDHRTYIQAATTFLRQRSGNATIDELATHLGYSSRQIRRLFDQSLGLGPKLYARHLRVARVIGLALSEPSLEWSHLALEAGYCDQSHCIREFRDITGSTPDTFLSCLRQVGMVIRAPQRDSIDIDGPIAFLDQNRSLGISLFMPFDDLA